ncbi:beta-ketoacyl-ACP synthase III [Clostridium cylindrosporum]|uniref:Beta-ketoacyl-[acyl-carrier-protein] synthase III n=1 Tax=Clostridium cylindrosporum DSM 605 TaxID=1121307 RepID=A0A0J8DFX8_CLOCY|nr:beta-ketoacyl-ACP synthase III [Clostridium cylindrosporum]KMT23139.1 3-oxoacyl-[acyl-carrier-protein] synthase 3 [Clostridium cylindrosporum DSM 605]
MKGIKFIGTGSYLPEKTISNDDLSKIMDTNDEWIRQRTGIGQRRMAIEEGCVDLATKAAISALENAKLKPEDIDVLIVATCTPDNYCPSVACMVQEKLLAVNAVAFDISAACTGFIFALKTAESLLKSSEYKNALVIGSEVMTKLINFENRNTAVLFGDGAGAAVISKNDFENGIKDIYIKTDGSGAGLITMPALGSIKDANFEDKEFTYVSDNTRDIFMEGREVFKFATTIMVSMVKDILEKHNLDISDIKYVVPHQANIRIIDYAAKKLKVSSDVFYTNMEEYANTSAASIPIALHEMNAKGLLSKGDNIILLGFGGGLTFGSALITW